MRARIELLLKQQKLTKDHIKDILQVCVLSNRCSDACVLIVDIYFLLISRLEGLCTLSMLRFEDDVLKLLHQLPSPYNEHHSSKVNPM